MKKAGCALSVSLNYLFIYSSIHLQGARSGAIYFAFFLTIICITPFDDTLVPYYSMYIHALHILLTFYTVNMPGKVATRIKVLFLNIFRTT